MPKLSMAKNKFLGQRGTWWLMGHEYPIDGQIIKFFTVGKITYCTLLFDDGTEMDVAQDTICSAVRANQRKAKVIQLIRPKVKLRLVKN